MKARIDNLISLNQGAQHFLNWVVMIANNINSNLKTPSIRLICHYLAHCHRDNMADFMYYHSFEYEGDAMGVSYNPPMSYECRYMNVKELVFSSFGLLYSLEPNLGRSFSQYDHDSYKYEEKEKFWKFSENLIGEFPADYNISSYSFDYLDSPQQEFGKTIFTQYYRSNELLIDCLNSSNNVSQEVKTEIVQTLLLPIAEIKKRQHQNIE
jgi:hypothetical protein